MEKETSYSLTPKGLIFYSCGSTIGKPLETSEAQSEKTCEHLLDFMTRHRLVLVVEDETLRFKYLDLEIKKLPKWYEFWK